MKPKPAPAEDWAEVMRLVRGRKARSSVDGTRDAFGPEDTLHDGDDVVAGARGEAGGTDTDGRQMDDVDRERPVGGVDRGAHGAGPRHDRDGAGVARREGVPEADRPLLEVVRIRVGQGGLVGGRGLRAELLERDDVRAGREERPGGGLGVGVVLADVVADQVRSPPADDLSPRVPP
ncbi:hypothetical protein ACF1BN_08615 [Streptomyces sp. NPDC014861]|uniref:hypothetical protein n=1 Tax=Streptomyces sp. NPDC014861 TaxID=3364923 RepID=UPI003701254C